MMEFKNKELNDVLINICGVNDKGQMVFGLLSENISLGLKRRLQKIHSEVMKKYIELQKDLKEVENIEDENNKSKELDMLLNESVKIDMDFASLEMIEQIQTKANYNFEIIEKFAK